LNLDEYTSQKWQKMMSQRITKIMISYSMKYAQQMKRLAFHILLFYS
jgi:hypothetical protein